MVDIQNEELTRSRPALTRRAVLAAGLAATVGVSASYVLENPWIGAAVKNFAEGKLPEMLLEAAASAPIGDALLEKKLTVSDLLRRRVLQVTTSKGVFPIGYTLLEKWFEQSDKLKEPISAPRFTHNNSHLHQYFEKGVLTQGPKFDFTRDYSSSQLLSRRDLLRKVVAGPENTKIWEVKLLNGSVKVPVLMFHDFDAAGRYSYPSESFEEILEHLIAEGYQFKTHLDLYKHFTHAYELAANVTDDGSENIPFTATQLPAKSCIIRIDDGLESVFTKVKPVLTRLTEKYPQVDLKAELFVPADGIDKEGYLNEVQMKELAEDPKFEFGGHGTPLLTDIPQNEVPKVLKESKSRIEALLGRPIWSYAYPGGRYTPQIVNDMIQAGYIVAGSTQTIQSDKDTMTQRPEKIYNLGALEISNHLTPADIMQKLRAA